MVEYRAGQVVELTTRDVAHGGWCVARTEDGPVVFVRHTLPGETVLARITEVTSHLARADAVDIPTPSPDRVDPPCPHAHPGGCGGCDWQHATLPAQRSLKAAVVRQQLKRLAGVDREVTVEPLPGDEEPGGERAGGEDAGPVPVTGTGAGLGWRTRVQFAVRADGGAAPASLPITARCHLPRSLWAPGHPWPPGPHWGGFGPAPGRTLKPRPDAPARPLLPEPAGRRAGLAGQRGRVLAGASRRGRRADRRNPGCARPRAR